MKYGPEKAEQYWYETKSEQFKFRFAPSEGMVRLYRGETVSPKDTPAPDWVKDTIKDRPTGSFFTDTYEEAQYYNKTFGEGDNNVTYIDIPAADLETYRASNTPGGQFSAPGLASKEFFVPEELAKTRKSVIPLDANGEPQAEWVGNVLTNGMKPPSDTKPTQPEVEITPEMFTKDGTSESQISTRIKALYDTAAKNPDKVYPVPYKRNTPGVKQTGGPRITMTRMAELFGQYPVPENVKFDPTFEGLMTVTPTRILNDIQVTPPTLIPVDAKILAQSKENNFLKMRDEFGTPTGGWFSYEKQQEAIDSLVYIIYSRYIKGMKSVQDIKNATEQVLKAGLTRHLDIVKGKKFKGFEDVTKSIAEQRVKDLQDILNVFHIKGDPNNLWSFAVSRLKMYGLNIYGLDSTEDTNDPNQDNLIDQNDGDMIRSYRDSSFELDRKDTASSRIKLFLSSIEDSDDRRIIRMAFTSALVREDILSGKKTTTIRTPEVAEDLGLKKGETAVTKIDGRIVKVMSLGPITESQLDVFADTAASEGIELKPGMVAYSLSLVTDESTLAIQKNYLGMPKLINFEDTFQKLMATLADQDPSLNNFMSLLWKSPDPIIRRVAEKLDRESVEVKNEFVSVMSNQYQEFLVTLFNQSLNSDGITTTQTRAFKANYSSQLNVLLRNWEQFQKQAPIAVKGATGNTVINKDLASNLVMKLTVVNDSASWDTAGRELFKELMEANGLKMVPAFYDNFVKNALNLTKGTRLQGTFERQFQFNKDGTPAGVISALIARLAGTLAQDEEADNSFQVNNPMYTEGTAMNVLARAALQFEPMVNSNSHKSSEGKSIYDHGLHTSTSHKIRRLKTDENYRNQKQQTHINEHNILLQALQNDPELRDRFGLVYMDGIKPEYTKGTSGTSRSDMSFREQLLESLALFEKKGNQKYADYVSLTHSDKTTTPIFENGPRIKLVTGLRITQGPDGTQATQAITNETYQALWNVFLDEYNRVTKTTESYNSDQFDKGKKFFFTMPEFNLDSMKSLLEKGEITKEEFNGLWTDLGAIKPIETSEAKRTILKLFNKRIETLWKRTHDSWVNEGLVTKDTVPFSVKYMNRLMAGVGIIAVETSPGNYVYNTRDGQLISKEESVRIASMLAARDYSINHFIFNASVSRLVFGDPAEVWKKSIPATLVEYQKRLAKDIAPGKDGEWSHSPQYTSITVEDWEGPASEVESLVSAYGEEVNATDAQELITVQEYLDGKLAVGQVTKQVYDEMSKIIKNANGEYYEFIKPEHKLAMVPQKPVYVGEGALQDGVILTHYIKSSAYPLLPAFTIGKQLDALRGAMEKTGVARVNFKSAAKMGRPAVKLNLFNKDGSMDTKVLQSAAFTGIENGQPVPSARQTLDRKGFRIQQEIPHDANKRKIGIVTQMNKLITQGIATITTPFQYQGNLVTPEALMNARSEIRKEMFNLKRSEVERELGVEEGRVKNFNKLYDSLLKEASNRPGYTINDLELLLYRDTDGKPLMPMIFSPSRTRFESLLMNKIGSMTEMKMYGHSFVQASSAGIQNLSTEMTDEQKKRVVFAGDYRGGQLQTLRHDLKTGEVKPAQVLVPFSFFAGSKKLDIKQFITTDENGYQVIDSSKISPEFLQLVGARIPNQGHSSMLPIEIVGFLPDEMADTIIVPAAITKQMGSDFDVDKLFTYQRPYIHSAGNLLSSEDYEDKLLNAYFDIHWSILMNSQMTKRILSPLDKPDLKMEADKVPLPADTDYFDVIEQLQSFQSQKFAKQLVGYTALTLTNNSVFESLNVTLGRKVINEETGKPEIVPFSLEMVDPNGQVHQLSQLSGYGESTNHDLGGARRTKHDNIVTLLSGFLDHAKDPVTPQINLNLYTFNAAAALLRLQSKEGVAAGIPELAALLRQPIIMEFAQKMSQANDSLSDSFQSDLYGKVIEDLGMKYAQLAGHNSSNPAQINLTDLRNDWTAKDSKPFYERQLAVLQLFDILWKMGRQLADVQSAYNWDVGGPGASIVTALSKENAITDTQVANPISGGIEIQGLDQMDSTEQGYIRENLMKAINSIALEVFPYDKLTPVLDKFKETTGATFISPKVQQALTEGFLAYQWTSAPIWGKDEAILQDRVRLFYSGNHGPSLAKRVQDAKISWGRNNYLLQRLESNLTTIGAGPDFVTYSLGISTGFDAAEVARSWNDILSSEDESRRQLGEDLVRYAILTGNTSTLARHIPVSYILGTSLLEATEELQTGEAIPEIFITQFLQHYPQYGKQISPDLKETGTPYEQYPESFTVPVINQEDPEHPARKLWVRKDGLEVYPQFLTLRDTETNKWVIYQQTSYLNYERIDYLGNNQIDEYSPSFGESIIPENKAYQLSKTKETQSSHAQEIYGIPTVGGWGFISNVLDQMTSTPTVPVLYQQLAEMLNKPQVAVENSLLTQTLGDRSAFRYEFTTVLQKTGEDAKMSSDSNLLQFSTALQYKDFNKTLIHELIHYHTAGTVTLFDIVDNEEYYKRKLGEENYQKWLKISRQLIAENPEIYKNVKALNTVREQAYQQFKKEVKELTIAEGMKEKLEYALTSNAEFLAHIFTDKDVMKWLNNRQASIEKSFWDKVMDAISAIMNSIAEFIGIGVQQGSLLEEGVKAAMNVMYMDKAVSTITPKGIAEVNPDVFKNSSMASMNIGSTEARKLETIIARLEDQKREIKQTFTGTITQEQAVRKRKLLDDLDNEILKLKDEQDLSLIASVGKTQLKWVNDIMTRKNPSINDIVVADRILELWTNLITVMYGDNNNLARVDKEWADIASEAQIKRQQLTNLSIDALIYASGGLLSRRDFSVKELEDPSWIQVRVRGLSSAAKSKVLQYVTTYMEQAGRMVNEEVLRVLKTTQKLEDDFLAYAGSKSNLPEVYKKLMQENKTGTAWGLVRRHSPTWYRFLIDTKEAREHRIDVINRDKGMSRAQKGQAKRIAWLDYWTTMKNASAFVDTRLFFDQTGENHKQFDKAFQELVTEVGQEQAEAAVKKAREKYKKYLELKEIFQESMEADVVNGSKTREQADKEIQEWTGRYSPNVFFDNFKNNFSVFNENNTDQYVVMMPKAKHTKYFDKKFTALQQDEKLYDLYNRLHSTLMKLRSYLPKSLQYQLGENFLPVVAKSLISDISGIPEYIKGMPDRFIRSLTASKWEETNKGNERIPISYVDTSKLKDPAEIASRSKDLVKITEIFAAMAIHYKHFANAKDVIDMGQSIIREIDRTRMSDGKTIDENGKVIAAPQGLKNAMEALQYMKEYVMFKKAKALEGNTGTKIYSANIKTQVQTANRVKELIIQKEKLNQQLIDGDIEGDDWKDKTEKIDQELLRYDGKPVYGSKVGDKLISIAQAKALSFNPFSAMANFTFGVVSAAIFANGRQEFGNKEFMRALRTMMKSTGKYLTFGGADSETARKIMNVMDRLGVMGDVVESQYGKLEHRERVPKWKKTINPYTWLRSGDYFCRGLNTVATLLKQQVKVTEDGVEKEISMWEALDSNGEWNETKYGKRLEYFSENVEDQTEWNKLRDKIARVNMIIMGNVDKVSPKMANKWIIGRLLGQFRLSWLPEGWYNRWAEEKLDIQLGRVTKGRFTTLKDLGIGGSLKVLLKQFASIVSKTDPFTGQHKMDGKPISIADIENMRKNFAEINFYLMVLGAIFMLRSMFGGDDDDDESQALQILINMIIRTKQDLTFYSSPEVFDTITRNAVPSFGVIKDYSKALDASWKIMTDDDYTADRWALKMTHAGLPIPQATLVNKIKYMSERDLDDLSR
jgi:hypothetical protein